MSYQIIACEDHEIIDEDIWTVFDKKCNEALSIEEKYIAVHLRSEMGSGVPLLDWIEKWQANFSEEGKGFYVISDDPQQLESMELSHPDQNLNYVSSIADFKDRMKHIIEETEETIVQESKEETVESDYKSPTVVKEQAQTVQLTIGDTVTIAGEYVCEGCGTTRMWMKGKKVTACKNPECFEPSKGWKLDFDLF